MKLSEQHTVDAQASTVKPSICLTEGQKQRIVELGKAAEYGAKYHSHVARYIHPNHGETAGQRCWRSASAEAFRIACQSTN